MSQPLIKRNSREYQRVSMRRPKQLFEINTQENQKRFKVRRCEQCRRSIMKHWILPFLDPELRSRQWCRRDASNYSRGLII